MPETKEYVELNSESLDRGYKSSRTAVKQFYKGFLWVVGNLPGDRRQALDAVLNHVIRTVDLFDLESVDNRSLDVWQEIKNELSEAFNGNCATVELAALSEAVTKYDIPKRYLLDSLDATDVWIRNRKFETFDELESFASDVGGSSMAAAVPVLGFVKPDYEVAAYECGKAVFLTQLLANCVNDIKMNKIFMAQEDLEDCDVVLHRLKLKQGGDPLKYLVRLYCSRIEKILYEGGKLIPFLDYDGRRSVTSLLAMHWRMLMQMKLDPESVLNDEGVLSRRDQLGLKSRHLLGLEGNCPIIPAVDEHHH